MNAKCIHPRYPPPLPAATWFGDHEPAAWFPGSGRNKEEEPALKAIKDEGMLLPHEPQFRELVVFDATCRVGSAPNQSDR
jgi:hypothetical protein